MAVIDIARMTSAQIRTLSRQDITTLSVEQLSRRNVNGTLGWNELSSTQVGYLGASQVASLQASHLRMVHHGGRTLLSDLSSTQIKRLGYDTVAALNGNDLSTLDGSGGAVLLDLSARQMKSIKSEAIRSLSANAVQQLGGDLMSYQVSTGRSILAELGGTQIRLMTAKQVSSFEASQLATTLSSTGRAIWNELSSDQIGQLSQGQILAMPRALLRSLDGSGRSILSDLTREQVQWLSEYKVMLLNADDLASTDRAGVSVLDKLSAVQIKQLSGYTVAALSAEQLGSQVADGHAAISHLSAAQIRHLDPYKIRQLGAEVVQQLDADQLGQAVASSRSLINELTGDQIRGLTLDQAAKLSDAQLASSHADGKAIASELIAVGKMLGMALREDTGLSDSDGITRDGVVVVSGLNTDRAWQYSRDGGATWRDGSGNTFDLRAAGRNLLVNGDFSLGKQGFSTDYRWQDQVGGASTVAVVTAPPNWGMGIVSGQGGEGDAFLMVDGSQDSEQAFWRQNVALKAGETYTLSFYASAGGGPAPRLELHVDGAPVGEARTLQLASSWTRHEITFNATRSGPVTLALKDLETSFGGNDFGVDTFSLVAHGCAAHELQVRQTDATGARREGFNLDAWRLDTQVQPPELTFRMTTGKVASHRVDVDQVEAGGRWEYSTDGGVRWTVGVGTGFLLGSGSYRKGDVQVRTQDAAGNVSSVASNNLPMVVVDLNSTDELGRLSRDAVIELGVDGLARIASVELRGYVVSRLGSDLVKGAAAGLEPGHDELVSFFQRIGDQMQARGSGLTESEFLDLRLLTNYIGARIGVHSQLYNVCNSLVNGDGYNAYWMNGRPGTEAPDVMGNLGVGSSATHLQQLTATWLLGQNNPRSGIYGGTEQFTNDVTLPPVPDVPLFGPSGKPELADVTQKSYGDCFLMATLAGLAQAAPGYVKSMFTDHGDGVYGVRLADQYYTLDTSFSSFASLERGRPIWPALLEKAYTEWRIEGGVGTNYTGIAWGASVDTVPLDLFGRENVNYNPRGYEGADLAIDALARGGLAVLASDRNIPGLNSPHAYTIVAYDAARRMFTLRNPWGFQDGGSTGGYIEVSYDDVGRGNAYMSSTKYSVEEIMLKRLPEVTPFLPPVLVINDTGADRDDGLTRDSLLQIHRADPGLDMLVRQDGGEWMPAGRATFGDNTIKMAEGRHVYEVKLADKKGNSSQVSAPITVDLDTTAPANHSFQLLDPSVDQARVRVTSMESGNAWAYSTDGGLLWHAGGAADALGTGTFMLPAPTQAVHRVKNGDFRERTDHWQSDYGNLTLVTGREGEGDLAIGFSEHNLRDPKGKIDIWRTSVHLEEAGSHVLEFDCDLSTRVHEWFGWEQIAVQAYVDGAPVGMRYVVPDSAGWQHHVETIPGLTAGEHTLSLRLHSVLGYSQEIGLKLALDNIQLVSKDAPAAYGAGEILVRQTDAAGNPVTVANAATIDWSALQTSLPALSVMPV